jgi:hypothetical protein
VIFNSKALCDQAKACMLPSVAKITEYQVIDGNMKMEIGYCKFLYLDNGKPMQIHFIYPEIAQKALDDL